MSIVKQTVLFMLFLSMLFATVDKKTIYTRRTSRAPVIDGVVDDEVWNGVETATGFFRFQPESGGPAPVRTEIKFLYDDVALYVAAIMYDPQPDQIPTQLGKRDDDNVHADWLGIWLNPFNDGANELNFAVTAAGARIDRKFSQEGVDPNWNPVWESDVAFFDQGWSLEMAIPFSQIRFPSRDVQTWGVNMGRYRASNREVYTWTDLDKSMGNFARQSGLLLGIEHIKTPLRLSLTPYAAVSGEHYPFNETGKSNFSTSYRGGMDLKYGINESFTLDMTLIPDYGQVQSDNIVLNLSPFEIRYDEHRPFFTEGTQLLHKAGLFYSRRVGSRPARYYDVAYGDVLGDGEQILKNPDETQLLNATKITGQTVTGVGLGFFNAITAPMYATIRDSLGNEREYLTNPLTNYNLVVVGKNLNNGSEISIANTNVQRFPGDDPGRDFRDANVIGFDARLITDDSKWALNADGAYDYLQYPDSVSTGYKYSFKISEEQGMFQYGMGHSVESDHYNPNDLGYLQQPNEFSQFAWLSLRTLNPIWKLNNAFLHLEAAYNQLFSPRVYTGFNLHGNFNFTFRNYLSWGGGWFWQPVESRDYYEPRVDGRYFTIPRGFNFHSWFSTNYNKAFAVNIWMGSSARNRRDAQWRGGGFSPRWRINNRWLVSYDLSLKMSDNANGFATYDEDGNPIFGQRDQITITNSIYSRYMISRDMESDIRARYYRSSVEYFRFYGLLSNGNLAGIDCDYDLNTVFGAFTIDAVLVWRFSPGSELNLTWKNAIYTYGQDPGVSYLEDMRELPSLNQSNSISLKILYYVDAWKLSQRL